MKKQYSPYGKYMWDTWFAIDSDGTYHAFYLESDIGDTRYATPSIGHAKSKDLKNWEQLDTVLEPGNEGDWDDLALWTGSVFKHKDKWYMFYTGRNKRDQWQQAIGLAISDDLYHWQKVPGPVLEPGDSRYSPQTDFNEVDNPPAWRDPFIFYDDVTEKFHMFFTARVNNGNTSFNGCIGRATSDDLLRWQTEEPVIVNEGFDEMEVPQMLYIKNRYYLLFSYRKSHELKNKPKLSSGLYCFVSNEIGGGYRPIKGWYGQIMKYGNKYYGMRLIKQKSNKHHFAIGWHHLKRGKFVGKMTDVYTVRLEPHAFSITDFSINIVDTFKKITQPKK